MYAHANRGCGQGGFSVTLDTDLFSQKNDYSKPFWFCCGIKKFNPIFGIFELSKVSAHY